MQDVGLTVAIAAFHDRPTAQRAVEDLEKNGFDHKQIGLITPAPDQEQKHSNADVIGRDHAKGALAGVGSGAVLGGVVGAAVAILIPGIGTVLVAGALLGLATGAIAGGLLGALTGMGIPKLDAHYYSKQFEAGHTLVTVAAESRFGEAREILRRNGGYENPESAAQATGTAPPGGDEGEGTSPMHPVTDVGPSAGAPPPAPPASASSSDHSGPT